MSVIRWGIIGLIISELLAWIFLSVDPVQKAITSVNAGHAITEMIKFGIAGLTIGAIVGAVKVRSRN
jgi:hypothetical protein